MNSKSHDMHHITVDKKSNSFKVGVSTKRGAKIFKETFCRTQYGTQKATIEAAKKQRKAEYPVADHGPRGAKMRAIVRREVEVERNCVTVFLPKKRMAKSA